MTASRTLPISLPQAVIPVALGLYAAAIALAPDARLSAAIAVPALLFLLVWWAILTPGRWILLFFAASLMLPPLPLSLGNSGPHPALLFAAAGVLAGIIRIGDWRIRLDLPAFALLLLTSVLLASVSLAAVYSGAGIALSSFVRVCLFGISVYVFFYSAYGPAVDEIETAFKSARMLFFAATGAALFACVDFYYQFPAPAGYGPQFVWLDSGVYRRAQGLFYEASTLGNFCAFFLVMIAVSLFQKRNAAPVSRLATLAGGAVLSAALILSFSRASVLNVAVAMAALLFLQRSRLKIRTLAAVLVSCLATGLIVSFVFLAEFAQAALFRMWFSGVYLFSAANQILSGRLDSWRILLDFLTSHPWHALFGIGYKTLPYTNFVGSTVIADNMYLSILVETGIMGLAAVLLLNFAILRAGYRAAHHSDPRTAFFGAWIFCFWLGQVFQMISGDLLTYWRVLPLYSWVLAQAVKGQREPLPYEHPVP